MTDLADQLLPQMNTIRGDLRDLMIGALSQLPRPWNEIPEAEQLQLAQVIDAHAQALVTRIAVLTATAGRPTVLVNLDKLEIGEKAKGTFSVSKDQAGALVPFTDQIVAIMAVVHNHFMGERAPVRTMPDQQTLPMGEAEVVNARPPATKTIEIVASALSEAGDTPGTGMHALRSGVRATVTPAPRKKPGPKPKANGASKKFGSPFAQ